MGERKVIQKYYPPDFDPSKIPKGRRPKGNQIKVRMMLPMSIRCTTCGEYLYKGKKFNSRKETVIAEEYLGIKVFRFYIRCTRCSSELSIKTDPKNRDYSCESGATRNFEPWKENEKLVEQIKEERREEEEGDAMKALENLTKDSKTEVDILGALDELRSHNARLSKITTEELWEQHLKNHKEQLYMDDEEYIKSIKFRNSNKYIRRIDEDDDEGDYIDETDVDYFQPDKKKIKLTEETVKPKPATSKPKQQQQQQQLNVVIIKKEEIKKPPESKTLSILADYPDSD